MKNELTFILATLLAVPALAEPTDPLEEDIRRALPPPAQVEAMAPTLDAAFAALLGIDVGPMLDAADPDRRHPEHGRPGRTLREVGRRDNPHFEQRLRGSIRGATADTARMMGALAATAPALVHSLREMERALDRSIGEYERRRPPPDED